MVYVYSFYASYVHHLVVSGSLQPHELWSVGLLFPWNFQGKNTGVGRHFLLQGILLTQGSKPGLLHCRWVLYHLSHQGRQSVEFIKSYKILEGGTLGVACQPSRPGSIPVWHSKQSRDGWKRGVTQRYLLHSHLGPSSHRCDLHANNGGTKNTHTHTYTHTVKLNQQLY